MVADLLGTFGFLAVLLRAAILCAQTLTIGGVIFLLVVASGPVQRTEHWSGRVARLVRRSALALACAHVLFLVVNTFTLMASAEIPLKDALGANFVFAGVLGIVASLLLYFWPGGLE